MRISDEMKRKRFQAAFMGSASETQSRGLLSETQRPATASENFVRKPRHGKSVEWHAKLEGMRVGRSLRSDRMFHPLERRRHPVGLSLFIRFDRVHPSCEVSG